MLKLDLWKLLLDLKSIASDILRYIFEPAEWIRYIAIYLNLPSEYDTWPADKPPIYLQKSFISNLYTTPGQDHLISRKFKSRDCLTKAFTAEEVARRMVASFPQIRFNIFKKICFCPGSKFWKMLSR